MDYMSAPEAAFYYQGGVATFFVTAVYSRSFSFLNFQKPQLKTAYQCGHFFMRHHTTFLACRWRAMAPG